MRIPLLIAIGIFMISTASGASDCTATPTSATKTAWCSDCYNHTFSELVCNTCNSMHINVEKTSCVDFDCTATQTSYNSDWCNACDLTKKVAASDFKSCVVATPDCKVKPTSATQSSWCSACFQKVYSELVCSVCDSMHVNYDSTSCIDYDCSVKPTSYTTSWCSACEKVNQTAASDGKSCVNIDCSVKPTNNYSDNWCNACSSPPTKALSDKSACSKSTTTSTKTSSTILQSLIVALFALIAII